MREKTRKLLLAAVMAALTVSLTAASLTYAFTFAKYTKEKSAGGVYGSEIEYVGAQVYGVKSAEELSAAIDNGYSYIEIDEDAKDPFDISDTVADITADLVLDLNGKTIRRNSRNPVFNVLEGVSVMIQVASFRLTGRRVFLCTPIHHHFEQKGWSETQIVIRFWIIAGICALIGLATLKLR